MGKVKNKRFKTAPYNSTVVSNNSDVQSKAMDIESPVMKSCVERLQSSSEEDKECSCTTIANLVEHPETTQLFLNCKVVRLLGPLLLDESLTVRKAALGALRNMTVDSDRQSICEEMVKQDIMTPLSALLQKFNDELQKEELSIFLGNVEVFKQALHLLWNICENSEIAVKVFNKQSLYEVLILALKIPSSPLRSDVILPIVQCLYAVSESNVELCNILYSSELELFHKTIGILHKNAEELLIRVNALGILQNVVNSASNVPESVTSELNKSMLAVLSEVLMVEVNSSLQEVLSALDNLKLSDNPAIKAEFTGHDFDEAACEIGESSSIIPSEKAICSEGKEDASSDIDNQSAKSSIKETMDLLDQQRNMKKMLNKSHVLLQAQQLSIELITNMCCTADDEWEDLDSSEGSCEDVSMEVDTGMSVNIAGDQETLTKDVEHNLKQHNIIAKVLCQCRPVNRELLHRLSQHKVTYPVLNCLNQLRCYSLLCLANLIDASSDKMLLQKYSGISELQKGNGQNPLLKSLWYELGALFINSCNSSASSKENDSSITEALTGALRSVLQKIVQTDPAQLNETSEEDLKFLCNAALSCKQPETRVNIIRIIGCIGCALAKETVPHKYLQGIGKFFCEVIVKEVELWIVAECLDCIFDVFGEDHLNCILKEIQLIETLTSLLPMMKSKVKEQKHQLGEHAVIVNEARNNLSRFIKYKSSIMK